VRKADIGEDTVVVESRMIALVEACLNPVVLKHEGGHFLPNGVGPRTEIINFVKKHLPENGTGVESGQEIGKI
jgi:Serine hydrolase (FSH1)